MKFWTEKKVDIETTYLFIFSFVSTKKNMDAYAYGAVTFATFVIFSTFGGPYNTADWAKKLRESKLSSEWMIIAVQLLWKLVALTGGLGIWFFLLTDWTNTASFTAIMALLLSFTILNNYCWPSYYFYANDKMNYFVVAGIYGLGLASLVTAWILMLVYQHFIVFLGFFWSSFSLLASSTLLSFFLAFALWYAHRGVKKPFSTPTTRAAFSVVVK